MNKLFLLILLSIVAMNGAVAAEFFRKQTGTTTLANGSTSQSVALSFPVDMSQSFLVFSSTIDSNAPQFFQIGGEITNSTTLTFARTGNTGAVSIRWQVFEFEGGVYVQHGSSTNVGRGAPVNVAINCVDLTKSFVLISARKSGNQLGADDGITANLTTTTNLQLMISNAGPGGADMEEAYWQVIEYQAAIVKKLTTTLSAGSTSTTSTISPAIGTLSKAFVISNHWFDGDVTAADLPRTVLTNTTTVTYTRNSSATNMNFVTYVIEFTDQSTVVRGAQAFASTVVSQNVAITAVASSGVFGSGNFGRQGSTSFSADDNTGHGWFTYEITSPTVLQIQRATGTTGGNSTANAPWQVITFEDQDIQQNTFYSRASGAWETNTSWSFTPDGSSGAVPTGVYPRRRNNVVIQNGHTITVNNVNDNGPCSQSPANLALGNVGPFTGSADQMFYHTGDIIISNGGTLTSSEEVMIAGYTLVENGGVFTITEDIVNLGYLEVSSGATFTNTDDLILSGNSTTIINNTSSSLDDIYIDHVNAALCGTGAFNIGGDVDPTVDYLNGATSAQICSTFPITCTDATPPCVPFAAPSGSFSFGNLGPGGVGDISASGDVILWLDASTISQANGTNLSLWNDRTGHSNNATAPGGNEPVYLTSQLNGFPSVQFTTGNADYLQVANHASLNPSTVSIFCVGNITSSSPANAGLVTKVQSSTSPYNGYGLVKNGVALGSLFAINDAAHLLGSSATYASGAYVVFEATYDQTDQNLFHNETNVGTLANASAITSNTNNLYLGVIPDGAGTGVISPLDGDIAEAIVFGRSVNLSQRILVANYLSAKYNVNLTANNVYTMDNGGNGDFDFDVAGIGQATDNSNHRDARGTGIVRMWNPNALGTNEYLIWGHDNGALTGTTSGVDGTIIEERFTRIWRVSENSDVGTVSVSFDFSSVGNPLGSNLRLLIDRDGDGFADNDITPIVGTVSGNVATFSGINFQDGDRFTLGNTDMSTPLPVELLNFNAIAMENDVILRWSTASEFNNDSFTIERSPDSELWKSIETILGTGDSQTRINYEITDTSPLVGVSYYRLKQTDFDGSSTYSSIERVEMAKSTKWLVYPNPSTRHFTLSGGGPLSQEQIRIFNSIGQLVKVPITIVGDEVIINAQDIPQGVYVLQISNGLNITTLRIAKN